MAEKSVRIWLLSEDNIRTCVHQWHRTCKYSPQQTHYNIWDIAVAQNKTSHPAVYPIEIPLKHIQSWSNEGDIVLDPFMGSGTTGLAALELNRKFIGIELNEEYFELSKQRILEKTTHPSPSATLISL